MAIGLLCAISLIAYLIQRQNGGTNGAITSCVELNSQTDKSIQEFKSKDDVVKTSQTLEENKGACSEKKRFLIVGSQESEDKITQLKFYHQKATTGYMLGKFEESKHDAEKGLEINGNLADSEKTLDNHEQIIKELEYVRDGTY